MLTVLKIQVRDRGWILWSDHAWSGLITFLTGALGHWWQPCFKQTEISYPIMMMSHGCLICITGPLCRESTHSNGRFLAQMVSKASFNIFLIVCLGSNMMKLSIGSEFNGTNKSLLVWFNVDRYVSELTDFYGQNYIQSPAWWNIARSWNTYHYSKQYGINFPTVIWLAYWVCYSNWLLCGDYITWVSSMM